jgi:hypothetical protein
MANKGISLLPCPEHYICVPWDAQCGDATVGRDPLAFLKLDIICHNDMGKQGLNFIDRKEPSWTDSKE